MKAKIEQLVRELGPSGHMREDHEDEARRELVDALVALIAEAKLAMYETVMRELAAEMELVDHDLYDTVIRIERTTYDTLMGYKS